MSKKRTIIGGISIMIIILALTILFTIKYSTKNIIGTFCTGEGMSSEDVYISIFSDNTLLIYRQHGPGTSGVYKINNYEHITALDLEMTDGRQAFAFFDNHDSLIFIDESIEDASHLIEFKRLSSTPVIINFTDTP